jgi:autotransporter translocation and assembly factor TamB
MGAALSGLRLRRAAGAVAIDLGWKGELGKTPALDGTVAITDPISIWPATLPAPITAAPAVLHLAGREVRAERLSISTSGAEAEIDGTLRLDEHDARASAIDGRLRAVVKGKDLSPWLRGKATASGRLLLDGHLGGSLRRPMVQAEAWLQAFTVAWPGSPVGTVRLDGILDLDHRTVLLRPLLAKLGSGGWLRIDGGQGPGRIEIAGLSPLRLGAMDLAVRGSGMATLRPIAGVLLSGLDLDLRLAGSAWGPVGLTGEVRLARGWYRVSRRKTAPPAAWQPSALPAFRDRLWLDVRLLGPDGALRVTVPPLPEVSIGFRCRASGRAAAPRITGELRGAGLYSRAVLALADWFSSRRLRQCDLGPRK